MSRYAVTISKNKDAIIKVPVKGDNLRIFKTVHSFKVDFIPKRKGNEPADEWNGIRDINYFFPVDFPQVPERAETKIVFSTDSEEEFTIELQFWQPG
jgi:hypothetical protein